MSLSNAEQETSVTYSAADQQVHIWTCIKTDLNRLRKDDRFTEIEAGIYNTGHEWAEFTIDRNQWNPIRGAKRKVTMTDEQKAAAADRLRNLRKAG